MPVQELELVKKLDIPFFEKRFDSEKPYPTNYIPLSTLKQVIEKSINHFKKEPNYGKYTGYEVATILSDLLTAITKMEGK